MSSAAMENFVMNVRTLSTQGNFNELNEFLQKNMELLVRNPAHLGTVLETLDFQQHSLGVLAVMSAKLQVKTIFIINKCIIDYKGFGSGWAECRTGNSPHRT